MKPDINNVANLDTAQLITSKILPHYDDTLLG
jgi:hypothetical protein